MPERTPTSSWIRFATTVADRAVAATAQAMHRAITDANFRWVGPLGRPVKAVHDAVVDWTWDTVRAAVRGAGSVAATVAARGGPEGDESPGAQRARAIALGSVDVGLIDAAPGLDHEMTLVVDGRACAPDPDQLRMAYPDASDRLVVFVHGLVDTEAAWTATTVPDEVAAAGATPLLVRYGSGRPVADNGQDLADLLDDIIVGWSVPVVRLVVVAHSMGGLVTRAAAATGDHRGHSWPDRLTDVVHIATPHLGSWLEKVANLTSWTLRRASTRSAPIGDLLDQRSRGIKDLRFGALADSPWGDGSVDDLLVGRGEPVPWPHDVTHHLVVGRLRPDGRNPLNIVLGDGLVRAGSATGLGRWRRIPAGGPVEVVEVAAGHNRLAADPAVAALVASVVESDTRRQHPL